MAFELSAYIHVKTTEPLSKEAALRKEVRNMESILVKYTLPHINEIAKFAAYIFNTRAVFSY